MSRERLIDQLFDLAELAERFGWRRWEMVLRTIIVNIEEQWECI